MSAEVNCPLTSSPPPCNYYCLHEGNYIIVEPCHVNWSSRWDRKGFIHCYIECYWHVRCSTVEKFGEHYSPDILFCHDFLSTETYYVHVHVFPYQAITNKCFAICQLHCQIGLLVLTLLTQEICAAVASRLVVERSLVWIPGPPGCMWKCPWAR